MASRKKQDEKNLKTLRELGTLQANKYCFDCNQRGPTYVDVTIGSFVCTKCSGLLRGITPPHRVKSISMATFGSEEIDLLRSRGNEYCRKVWLGLYEGPAPNETTRDEQTIKDFMMDKYEKKRYYVDPSQLPRNGFVKPNFVQEPKKNGTTHVDTLSDPKTVQLNGNAVPKYNNDRKRPKETNPTNNGFIANFETADIFSAVANCTNNNAGDVTTPNQHHKQQQPFANFDNNPVFNNIHSSFPTSNGGTPQSMSSAPAVDRYAALKDLDNALKSQQNGLDWNSTGSNGSLYSSPNHSGSVYSSPSPSQSSLFGSPTQGQFVNGFPESNNSISNPFGTSGGGGNSWKENAFGTNIQQNHFANPFRTNESTTKINGFSQIYQPTTQFAISSNELSNWAANPFKVGGATATINTNNPFL